MSVLAIRVLCDECYSELEYEVVEGTLEDSVYVKECENCKAIRLAVMDKEEQ